ncbi:MAG: nuclear transport factor 2 family protein [Bauldia sp.]|nr:nuclear transport factor 2 family protein [Bauldia sp.]
MPEVKVPEPLRGFVEAVNRGDLDAVLGYFGEDGTVEDWGRRFTGPKAITRWSDKEFIGAKGHLTITGVKSASPTEIRVATDWKSNYFSGAGEMVFLIDGPRIREMRILGSE